MKVIRNVATLLNVNRFAWMLPEEVNVYLNVRNTLVIKTAAILPNVNRNVLHQLAEVNVCHNVESMKVIENVAIHHSLNVNKCALTLLLEVNVYHNAKSTKETKTAATHQHLHVSKYVLMHLNVENVCLNAESMITNLNVVPHPLVLGTALKPPRKENVYQPARCSSPIQNVVHLPLVLMFAWRQLPKGSVCLSVKAITIQNAVRNVPPRNVFISLLI